MVSQAESERCFEAYVVDFHQIFRSPGDRHCFNVVTWKFCLKKDDSVAAF